MRCISPADVPELLGSAGFSVSLANQWYRTALVLDPRIAGLQARVGAGPPNHVLGLQSFLESANRWLPPGTARVLWVDHFQTAIPGDEAFLMGMRRGFGERRALADAPGHYFEPQPWNEQDWELVTADHAAALSLLVGISTILLTTTSDGWIVAPGVADRIEFWEGNTFFHSADPQRLDEARDILADCLPKV